MIRACLQWPLQGIGDPGYVDTCRRFETQHVSGTALVVHDVQGEAELGHHRHCCGDGDRQVAMSDDSEDRLDCLWASQSNQRHEGCTET